LTADIIPKTWTVDVESLSFHNGNTKLSASSRYDGTESADKACDGNDSTSFRTSRQTSHWLKLEFDRAVEIKKIKTKVYSQSSMNNFKIQGSNNDTDWTDLLTVTPGAMGQSVLTSLTLTTTGDYKFYRIYVTMGLSAGVYFYEWQVEEYIENKNVFLLTSESESYEDKKFLYIVLPTGRTTTGKTYININSLGEKLLDNSSIEDSKFYILVYNGTVFKTYKLWFES
jgi:hypothetical protein